MHKTKAVSLSVSALALLTGCHNQPTLPNSGLRLQPLSRIQHWQVSGSLSIQQGKRRELIRYRWQHEHQTDRIRLSGPLGIHATTLTVKPQSATLQRTHHATLTAKSVDQLIYSKQDWPLPIQAMRYWIRGLLAPGLHTNWQRDTQGHNTAVTQQQWRVHWLQYRYVGGYRLPKLMTLQRDQIQLRLSCNDWRLWPDPTN